VRLFLVREILSVETLSVEALSIETLSPSEDAAWYINRTCAPTLMQRLLPMSCLFLGLAVRATCLGSEPPLRGCIIF